MLLLHYVMTLQHLSIINFKNIESAEIDFSPSINCIIGNNGEGKTNLLDAVHFLSLCKSAIVTQDGMCIRHDCDMMLLRGTYVTPQENTEEISIGLKRGQKKIVKRGQKAYKRIAEHIGLIPLVVVSPQDIYLVSGASEDRRKFLDIVISQTNPAYLDALLRYNKALAQRNILLKQDDSAPDVELLMLWEEQMAIEGERIYKARKEFVEDFTPIFKYYYNFISQEHEDVTITYTSHCQRGSLLEVIQGARHRDLAVGYSLHGTHRDDLELMVDGYPIKREGSQGQTKTMLIALKLAQYDFLRKSTGCKTPILILDDIFDRLDSRRVERLVELVSGDKFGQTFITDTNREHLDRILERTRQKFRLFKCKSGEYTQIGGNE